MNRYMHSDFYPNFHVTFIKKGKINDIPLISLTDMGFPYDVDYREQPLFDLPKDKVDEIVAEFMFLIDKILPRNIQDLFYRIALDPRPAYWKAFEKAADNMQLERYDDYNSPNFGQFVDHVQLGIQDLFEEGLTLSAIYESTCVTRDMLIQTVSNTIPEDYKSKNKKRWLAIPIEIILFGMKDIEYKVQADIGEMIFDFLIYKNGELSLAIIRLDFNYYGESDQDYTNEVLSAKVMCEKKGIPLLLVDSDEFEDSDETHTFGRVIRRAIGNIEYAQKHNSNREKEAMRDYESWGWEDDCNNLCQQLKRVEEGKLILFKGQIKKMKLISNHIYFNHFPEPDDEVEQHLSMFSDGRVFFSGYHFGNSVAEKCVKSRDDLFAFDGAARFPIKRESGQFIFVNVSFWNSGRTYCYLCDDELVMEGDEVEVPVGSEGATKIAEVESIEIHIAEDAPFPVDRCKKVIAVIRK